MCVPDLSPREMNGARLGLDRLQRGDDVLVPLTPAGSLFGPIRTKSLYITG